MAVEFGHVEHLTDIPNRTTSAPLIDRANNAQPSIINT
jgi:hypothetical protein